MPFVLFSSAQILEALGRQTSNNEKLLSQKKTEKRKTPLKMRVNINVEVCVVLFVGTRMASRRNQSIRFPESWQCTSDVSTAHKSHIQEDQALQLLISIYPLHVSDLGKTYG